MSRQTHPFRSGGKASSNLPEWHGDPSRNADLIAPTAPHARPGGEGGKADKLSGPARFWSNRRVRVAFTLALLFSFGVHWWVAPWNLLPPSAGIDIKDNNDELAIPIDIMGEEPPPPPPPPPPAPAPVEPETPKSDDPNAPGKRDAGPPAPKLRDAGVPLSTTDAGEAEDAGEPQDAGAIVDAGEPLAMGDGGTPGTNGPRDPEGMFGLSKVVNAGVQNVVLGVNIALIRTHPVGSRMGPILQSIPQWRDFLKGSQAAVEPVRDTDWILIYGPSLIHTDKDAVLVRYNAPDSVVDQTIAGIAKSYDKGGPFDAGVPGVPGSLGFADNAQRVFIRPQPKLLVIIPPSHAHEAAVVFKKQVPKGPSPKEAMRLIVHDPWKQISIRGLKFSNEMSEIRLWIIPRANDGGADVFAEGDCASEQCANDSADQLTQVLKNQNSLGVRLATHGLLNNAKVVAEGKKLTLHVDASQDQLEAVLQLIAAALNVNLAPPPAPTSSAPRR